MHKAKNYAILTVEHIYHVGIKIGIFEAAESIPMLGFTPKCKGRNLIILLLV